MKIAFVNDWLVNYGWAEKVFFDLINDIKESNFDIDNSWNNWINDIKKYIDNNFKNKKIEYKIFTNFYNPDFQTDEINIESVLKWKNIWKYYRNLMPIFPIFTDILSKKIKKYNPDLVIISSFAIGKNLNIDKPKILYLHSPMQYIWSHYDEYLNKFTWIKKQIYKFSSIYLKKYDKKYLNFEKIYCNSTYTKDLAVKIYWDNFKKANIMYPKVEIPNYKKVDIFKKYNIDWEYFLYIWRLVKFVKHLDFIIKTFNKTWKKLVIVWNWPDKKYLKSISKKNIEFIDFIDNKYDDYWNLIENSKAVINLTKESFWIVNYQVLKLWKTLISINHGAIKELSWNKILLKNKKDLKQAILDFK